MHSSPFDVQGRLDLFFLLLAGLMAANLALYLWVASNYEYKAVEHVKRVTLPRTQRQVGFGGQTRGCRGQGQAVEHSMRATQPSWCAGRTAGHYASVP